MDHRRTAASLAILLALSATGASAQDERDKVFSWPQLLSGDCVMVPGSQVIVRADGSGSFRAVTYTNHTHSGDVWHHSIELRDADGDSVARLRFDSPRMDDGSPPPRYTWGDRFRIAPDAAARVARASVVSYSC